MLAVERRQDQPHSTEPLRLPSAPHILSPRPIRLTSPPNAVASSSKSPPRRPPSRTERKFACSYPDCDKAYFKPSRLVEHELTHSGVRPHQCPHCPQSYLRASHLSAHMRTHLSPDSKPFVCTRPGCDKRFWTATHLRRHDEVHDSAPSYQCTQCDESFTKAHAHRDHVTIAHMPAGTKPYPCHHEGCSWSFALKHQLKAHERTHDPTRYTCSHPSHDTDMPCFPTWSALQSHMHTAHSPTCPHEHCHGRVFKSASRLKDHLKVHAERDADLARRAEEGRENMIGGLDVTNGEHGVDYVPDLVLEGMVDLKESRRAKKRRLSEVHGDIPGSANKLPRLLDGQEGKEFACEAQGCSRMFKTRYALVAHISARHLDEKPHHCPRDNCSKSFAHQSNLQRHIQTHNRPFDAATSSESRVDTKGLITGSAKSNLRIICPIHLMVDAESCHERFNRVYDVRRHLKAEHEVELDDFEVRSLLVKLGNGCRQDS